MNYEEFKMLLFQYAKNLEIVLSENQVKKFYEYMLLLLEWNERINLTSITDEKNIVLKHFVDSITICKYIPKNAKLLDVGTGAGFPGIPAKIVRDDIEVVLLDSLNKRILFLDDVIDKLDMKNIQAVHGRAEEFGRNKDFRQSFDVVTSRAVANMAVLSEYLIPFSKLGGKCVIMKGSDFEEELNNSKKAIKVLGGKINSVDEFVLPASDMKRTIVVVDKIGDTPKQYPRKAGTPAKKPIS